jgi:hypothetical protein
VTVARWRWSVRRTVLVVGAAAVVLVLLGSVVVLTGGGGSASSVGMAEPAIGRGAGGSTGADGAVSADAAAPAPAAPEAAGGSVGPDGSGFAEQGLAEQGVPVGAVERSLVRSAQVTLDVEDPVAGVQGVRAAAAAAGGTVTQEQSGPLGGWVVVRVPADALDRLTADVAELGVVLDRSVSVVDATEEVVDLDARVASQQASVARVRALLAEATSIGDVVAIESELARREAELDSLTGRLAALRDQVALSTLTVDLRGPDALPVGPDEPVGFGDGLAAGWEGLLALGRGTGAVLGFLLPFVPVVLVLAVATRLVVRLVRGRSRPVTPEAP